MVSSIVQVVVVVVVVVVKRTAPAVHVAFDATAEEAKAVSSHQLSRVLQRRPLIAFELSDREPRSRSGVRPSTLRS